MVKKSRLAEISAHVIIWLTVYLILITLIKTVGPFKKIDGTLLLPATFGTLVNIALFYITSLVLIPLLSARKKVVEFALLLILVLLFFTLTETLIDSRFFVYFYSDNKESFASQLVLNLLLNIIILSLALGYGFTKNWFRNEKQKQQLIQEKLTAELNFMKSQLNPHFLFNVLNMAYSSANLRGDEKTADIIEKLSSLMRYMLYESNVDQINLEKEIEYINNFINLQKMRFSEEMKVDVKFEITGECFKHSIAPLILIQFIENAFKYGVKLGKVSVIEILLEVSEKTIRFEVKNPKFQNTPVCVNKASGIGIANVRKRLNILYPSRHQLVIQDTPDFFNVKLLINSN